MNTKKYYIYSFFGSLFPIYPLYLLMMENEGFTVAQISMLLAIWSIPCVLLEIPSGILADRWSRKNMLVLGAFLKALCYFTWFISKNYISIAIGFIFWGIGSAFRSGSEEALLYDSLLKEKKEEQFDRIYGKGNFLSGVSNVLAAVTGGIIGMRYGYNTALILSVASGFISTTIALSFKEVNIYREQQNEDKNFIGTLGGAVFFLIKDKKLFMFAIMTLLVITMAE